MGKDTLKGRREKARYVLEIRYEPIVQAFDRRGRVLEIVHPRFKSKLEHWRIQNVEVTMADDFDAPARLIRVGHLRSSITYEDPDSRQEFLDDSMNFLTALDKVFPEGLRKIKRMGFRSICVMKHETASDFDEVFRSVKASFLHPNLPSSLQFSDCAVTLKQDACRLVVGPVKRGEEWVQNSFSSPDQGVPEFGVGLDVDSFAYDLDCKDTKALCGAARALFELALQVEAETLNGLTQ